MKNSYLVIFFYFTFLNVFSQNGIVFYEFTDAIGVGGGNGEIYNAYTMFTKDKSYYVVGKDSLENAISKSKAKEFYNNKDGSYNTISSGLILTAQGQQVVCDYKTKTLLCNVFDGKHTYVKEPLPNIKWKITKQKKKLIFKVLKKNYKHQKKEIKLYNYNLTPLIKCLTTTLSQSSDLSRTNQLKSRQMTSHLH
jgi:GLPGLI family protein